MAIHLKWSNQNTPGNSLYIYRNEGTTITEASKGTAIATLDSNAVAYVDNTTEPGKTYAYLVEIRAPLGSSFSRPTVTANLRRVGPGGVDILTGDSEFGYMGQVPSYELPDVWTALGFERGKTNAAMAVLKWYKFVRKGKIMYVPSIPMTTTYNDYDPWLGGIWAANVPGIASGLDWNFDISAAKYNPYRKTKILTAGIDRFHLRAPRAYPDNWNGVHNAALTLQRDTEMNQLIQSMMQGCIIGNQVGSVTPQIWAQGVTFMRYIAAEALPQSNETLMCEYGVYDHNYAIVADWVKGYYIVNTYNSSSADQILAKWRNGGAPALWPVLQLIEE